jgi:diacylglycerol O-acyltransferase
MSTRVGLADRIFLLQESSGSPQHVAALGTFELPADAAPDYLTRLVASYRSARTFAAPYNYRLRSPALKAVLPGFVELPDDEIDLDFHFRHSALPPPGGERELGVLVSRLHSLPLDLDRPLWEVHLIEGLSPVRFALYFKVHHALMDGVGGSRRLQQMLTPDPTDTAVRPAWSIGAIRPPEAPETSEAPVAGHSLIGRLGSVAGGVREGVETVGGLGLAAGGLIKNGVWPSEDAIATPYKVPGSPLNGRIGRQRRVGTQAIDFDRAREIADRANVTINDVFLAICSGGLRRYLKEMDALPESSLVAGTPVSVRVGDGDSSNNAFTIALMKIYTDIPDPVQRIRAIHRSSTVAKESLSGLSKPVAENYGALFMTPFIVQGLVGLGGRLKPPYNLIISNVPGPLETQYLAGSRLEAMYPIALLAHGMGLFIASLAVSGKMGLGFTGDRERLPHLQRLAVYTGEAVAELEDALASTPVTRRRNRRKPKS